MPELTVGCNLLRIYLQCQTVSFLFLHARFADIFFMSCLRDVQLVLWEQVEAKLAHYTPIRTYRSEMTLPAAESYWGYVRVCVHTDSGS